jgi:enamine deaminase RidA (YjgF/YER057c/UK114 family)
VADETKVTERRNVSSGGPWESLGGYSRAVFMGDSAWVAGTTDAGPDGRSRHPGDIAAQTRAVFEIIRGALEQGGFALGDVVRTRMFLTDIGRAAEVNEVHQELFGAIRPAAAMVQVSALIDPSLLIEIEVDARR